MDIQGLAPINIPNLSYDNVNEFRTINEIPSSRLGEKKEVPSSSLG